jgi:hypothetical protein
MVEVALVEFERAFERSNRGALLSSPASRSLNNPPTSHKKKKAASPPDPQYQQQTGSAIRQKDVMMIHPNILTGCSSCAVQRSLEAIRTSTQWIAMSRRTSICSSLSNAAEAEANVSVLHPGLRVPSTTAAR